MSSASESESTSKRTVVTHRWLVWSAVLAAVLLGLGAGIHLRWWRQNLRRFRPVRPGVLYRSGQPSQRGLTYLAERHGVRTDLSLRRKEPRLRTGLLFKHSQPDGPREEPWARSSGIRYLRWPLGDEVYWPWVSPWHFENLFPLFDDRDSWPILIHCAEGRHRTGTYAALFRLEYDRWDVERTLQEMYSFDFGPAQFIQEHNLRTYLARPRPGADQWAEVSAAFADLLPSPAPGDYDALVHGLRRHDDPASVRQKLAEYLRRGGAFCLPLAHRLIDWADDPLAGSAAECAAEVLESQDADGADWSIGASLVADFGTPGQQDLLLRQLRESTGEPEPSPKHEALVAGVTNRYTENRIAYLHPLLDDTRRHRLAAAAKYRYRDTAVARLTSIVNQRFVPNVTQPDESAWNQGAEAALKWFAEHPEALTPKPLTSDALWQ